MARIRSVKPEFWSSEQVMECSPTARLLFIGLWNFCDDAGNHVGSLKTIKAEIFPGDDIDSTSVRRLLDELSSNGLIAFYTAENKEFLHVTGWHHQKIDKPTYKYPAFTGEKSEVDRRTLDDSSPPEGSGEEGSGEEGSGEESTRRPRRAKRAQTPIPENFTVSDRVKAWATGKGFDRLDEHCESFRRKCTAKGYTYADWDSAFMEAIREDWAKLRIVNGSSRQPDRAIDMPSPAGNRRLA